MVLDRESAMERWLKFEFQNINKNIVKRQVSLAELLKMVTPKTETKDGVEYIFDPDSLNKFSLGIPQFYHGQLMLPIYFYSDLSVKGSCFISDEVAVKALHYTKDLEPGYQIQDGRLWLAKPIAFDLAKKYPTLFQFVLF